MRNTGGDVAALDGSREDKDMVLPPIPSDDDRAADPSVGRPTVSSATFTAAPACLPA